jgi:hypothetical protein
MNEPGKKLFQGTLEDFERFKNAMESEGLEVVLEKAIPVGHEGSEFDFSVIQLIAILRLSQALAELLQCSTEEVHEAFLAGASHEALSLSMHEKMAIFNHFYSNR